MIDLLSPHTTVAIIGFGRFGQVLTTILLKHSKAKLIIITKKRLEISHKRLSRGDEKRLKEADVIIPCVPISHFEQVITHIAPMLKDGALVMDVCSVKEHPVQIMKQHLPTTVQIIASHPMFGPDSYRIKKKLDGLTLVLCNVSAKKTTYSHILRFWKQLRLNVVELTPAQHDKYMAWSLGYSYLIGKIGERMRIKKTPIDTYDFQLLLEQCAIVRSDSDELFFDMQTKNLFASEVRKEMGSVLKEISHEIEAKEIKK